MSEQQSINVNWVQALAGALAAMSSAVLLSTVGVAGTIIGAAVGSVIATVGSAIYSYYLETSKKRVAVASTVARERAARARGRIKGAADSSITYDERAQQLQLAEQDLSQVDRDLERAETNEPDKPRWLEILRGLRWKRIGLVALGIFLAAMAVILVFELVAGKSVSSYTGGSDDGRRSSISFGSGSGSGSGSDSGTDSRDESDRDSGTDSDPEDEPSPSATPSSTPEDPETTDAATPSATPNEEQPTEAPAEEPSEAPSSAAPSASPRPTPTPSVSLTPSPSASP